MENDNVKKRKFEENTQETDPYVSEDTEKSFNSSDLISSEEEEVTTIRSRKNRKKNVNNKTNTLVVNTNKKMSESKKYQLLINQSKLEVLNEEYDSEDNSSQLMTDERSLESQELIDNNSNCSSSLSEELFNSEEEKPKLIFEDIYFVITSAIASQQERENYMKKIKENGGKIIPQLYNSNYDKFSKKKIILIADKPSSKPSYLISLLFNIPLLKKEWIDDCITKNDLILNENEIKSYLLKRGSYRNRLTNQLIEKEQQFNRSLECLMKEKRVFYGSNVKIIYKEENKKFVDDWKPILEAGGALIDNNLGKQNVLETNFLFVKDNLELTSEVLEFAKITKLPIIDKDAVIQMIITLERKFNEENVINYKDINNILLTTPKKKRKEDAATIITPTRKRFNLSLLESDLVKTPTTPLSATANNNNTSTTTPKSSINYKSPAPNVRSSSLKDVSTVLFPENGNNNGMTQQQEKIKEGNYFFKGEKKLMFIRIGKEKDDSFVSEIFRIGDVVVVIQNQSQLFVRIDELLYDELGVPIMKGTIYKDEELRLIDTKEKVQVSLSNIQYKLLINEEKNCKMQFYSDYKVEDSSKIERIKRNEGYLTLPISEKDDVLYKEIEWKREKRKVSLKWVGPYKFGIFNDFVSCSCLQWNNILLQKGDFIRFTLVGLTDSILIGKITELRELNIKVMTKQSNKFNAKLCVETFKMVDNIYYSTNEIIEIDAIAINSIQQVMAIFKDLFDDNMVDLSSKAFIIIGQ
ncbi:hypothetical protein ABK040_002599 [Willaertia magna]